jgi:spermidine/putrescine-binding protein
MIRKSLVRSLHLLGAAVIVFSVLSTSSAVAQTRFDGVTLTVATFPGAWREAIIKVTGAKFEALGGKLQWTPGSTTEFLQQAIAARGGYVFDVVEVVEDLWSKWMGGGFVQKWDHSKLSNLSQLDSKMYDDYRVGHWIVLQSIIYNVDKFKENGIPAPKKFSDLIHPKLKKRVVSRDFTNFTGIYPVVGLAHDFGGSEANITPGLEKLKEMDLHSFLGFSSQGPQLMEAGDVWASMLHAGWGVRLIKAGQPVAVVHPEVAGKKGLPTLGYIALSKASKNKEAAHWLMNELIGAEQQEEWYNTSGIVPVNNTTLKKVSSSPVRGKDGNPALILDAEELANAYYVDYSHYDVKAWNEEFNRIFFQ